MYKKLFLLLTLCFAALHISAQQIEYKTFVYTNDELANAISTHSSTKLALASEYWRVVTA